MTLLDDYRAIREGAAIGATARRAQLAVAGKDRASYLQGLLTNDIVALTPGSGCYAAWLTPQGRMQTDMHVLQSDSMILLDVPFDHAASILERLDQFLFSEDVQLASLVDSLASVWIHGPGAAGALASVVAEKGCGEWPDYRHAHVSFADTPVVLARIDQLGVPGFCLYVERTRAGELAHALSAAGAVAVDAGAIEAARIEAGYPLFDVDMTSDTIPLEAGIEDRAISQTKGCYVGQEIVIRVLHRGGGRVARKLVAIRADGAVPERGAKVFSGEREIGFVTSAAESPALGSIALGYVHRDFASAGTPIEIASHAGRTRATVSTRPMAGREGPPSV